MHNYYLSRKGERLGPFAEDQILMMWKNGDILPSDQACMRAEEQVLEVDVWKEDDIWVSAVDLVEHLEDRYGAVETHLKRTLPWHRRGMTYLVLGSILVMVGIFYHLLIVPLGLLLIVYSFVVDRAVWVCELCGAQVGKRAKVCPGCLGKFPERHWWHRGV